MTRMRTKTAGQRRHTPEKRLQLAVKRVLWSLGFHVSDLSQPRATMQTPGLPDLYAQHPRWQIRVWIECKSPGGRLSPVQEAWHDVEGAAGGRVLVVYCIDDLVDGLVDLGAPIQMLPSGAVMPL